MTNCIVSCNQLSARSTKQGAAIYIGSGPSSIVNCTIARNTSSGGGIWLASGKSTITSSIVWANSSPQIGGPAAGSAVVTYSDVQGGFGGIGNKNVNPAFTGTGCLCQDLAIVPNSPVQDMGNPATAANDSCFPPLARHDAKEPTQRHGRERWARRLRLAAVDQLGHSLAPTFGRATNAAEAAGNRDANDARRRR